MAEDLVTHYMAQPVVVAFEIVEIEKHHTDRSPTAGSGATISVPPSTPSPVTKRTCRPSPAMFDSLRSCTWPPPMVRICRPAAPKAPALVATVRPPKVTVERTIWHPIPERRWARIEVEGRKEALELHEGDAVGTLVVAEIQPSGVVFLHGGERFHRKVGTRR